jgi:hypothetical protein
MSFVMVSIATSIVRLYTHIPSRRVYDALEVWSFIVGRYHHEVVKFSWCLGM